MRSAGKISAAHLNLAQRSLEVRSVATYDAARLKSAQIWHILPQRTIKTRSEKRKVRSGAYFCAAWVENE
jgi:hypothetical protein